MSTDIKDVIDKGINKLNQLLNSNMKKSGNVVILNIFDKENVLIIYKASNLTKYEKYTMEEELFSQDYCKSLIQKIDSFISSNNLSKKYSVDIIVPDGVIFSDIINVPILKRKPSSFMLDTTLNSLYKNRKDLYINNWIVSKNKEQVVFSINGIQNKYLREIRNAFYSIKQSVSITFFSASQINYLNNLVGLNNGLIAFLNLKEDNSSLCFKFKNSYVGSTLISFGYDILSKEVKDFNELFKHEIATSVLENAGNINNKKKKRGRKKGKNGEVVGYRPYDNFTIFVKIVLDYIKENFDYKIFGVPQNVYVSMPKEYAPLLDKVNADIEDNGVRFLYLEEDENEDDKLINQLSKYNIKFGPESL